jgi:hypothetical protein
MLTRAGVLQVVAERRVRGAVERTYMLRLHAAQIDPGQIATMSPEQHTQAFMAFVAGLLADFDRYVSTGQPDPVRDRAGYRMAALWLTDSELDDFLRELAVVIQPRLANAPTKKRRRRVIAGVMLPAPETRHGGSRPRGATRSGPSARG